MLEACLEPVQTYLKSRSDTLRILTNILTAAVSTTVEEVESANDEDGEGDNEDDDNADECDNDAAVSSPSASSADAAHDMISPAAPADGTLGWGPAASGKEAFAALPLMHRAAVVRACLAETDGAAFSLDDEVCMEGGSGSMQLASSGGGANGHGHSDSADDGDDNEAAVARALQSTHSMFVLDAASLSPATEPRVRRTPSSSSSAATSAASASSSSSLSAQSTSALLWRMRHRLWRPDPLHADPVTSTAALRRGASLDCVGQLLRTVHAHGGGGGGQGGGGAARRHAAVIGEYQTLLAQRLLVAVTFDTDQEVRFRVDARFGFACRVSLVVFAVQCAFCFCLHYMF